MILGRRRYVSGGGFAFGNALQSASVNNYAQFTTGFIGVSTDATISLWFYNTGAYNKFLISNTSNSRGIILSSSTVIQVLSGVTRSFTIPTLSTSTWYYLSVTIDSSNNQRVYLNATESSTGALAGSTSLNLQRIFSSANPMQGKIDDVAIKIGYQANATDITNIYNGGSGNDFISVIGSANGYWHLDESGSDLTAIDSSGNVNDAPLTGFTIPGDWVAH